MRYICHDCGNEIPEDMDFCPRCGCMANKSTPIDDSGYPMNVCPGCGAVFAPGDRFCGSCGARLPDQATMVQPFYRPKLRRNGMAAILLALIPGFFNVFGLGHLLLRQWSRGCMFLALGLLMWYFNGWSFVSTSFLMAMMSIAVFFYQAMDVLRAAYAPEGRRWTGPRSTARRPWTASWGTRRR